MSDFDSVETLWKRYCDCEKALVSASRALFASGSDLVEVLDAALDSVAQRRAALRLLGLLPAPRSRPHLGALVRQASVGVGEIGVIRSAILRMDREWVTSHIESHVLPVLEAGGDEEHRRIAELYQLLDDGLLAAHLRRCAAHAEPEVREIAADYSRRTKMG